MDEAQRQSLLQAIAISSGVAIGTFLPQQRQEAFQTLEQFKAYDGRIQIALHLLQCPSHVLPLSGSNTSTTIDVTAATKLYALLIMQNFLKSAGYAKLSDQDRVALRVAVLASSRQLAAPPEQASNQQQQQLNDDEVRMLAMKLSTLLADIVVRDFPQRWPTFVSDVYVPLQSRGGLWCEPGSADDAAQRSRGGYGPMIGVKIALECLRLVTEDCTDSDYNAKISTKRRNDVLIGLNEVSGQFLPLVFALLSEEYGIVSSAKTTLREMEAYLSSSGRTVAQMTQEERTMYDAQLARRDGAGRLVADCLRTIERFCSAMPLDWILGGSPANGGSDFVSALLHLMREDVAEIQVLAVACLEQLATRKLEVDVWMKFITALPQAVSEANDVAAQQQAARPGGNQMELLVEQLPFHRGLSRMLALLLSAHVAHISSDKDILKGQGPKYQAIAAYLNLLAEMLAHPSGRICGEQINLWVTLLRDPNTSKGTLLTPFIERVLVAFMTHVVRFRWEDVDEERHQYSSLIEASWTDNEEYDSWLCDLRSKCSQLLKHIGNAEPKIAVLTVQSRISSLLSMHGNGEPRDHLDPATNQLTQMSEAVLQFEGATQPLDNILQGLPDWAVRENAAGLDQKKDAINNEVRTRLSELAQMIVSWNPTETWLKFRRVDLIGALKHYWKHEPSTLLAGVDGLLMYLSVEEWKAGASNGERKLTDDVVSLRKRSGIALISVSKCVPNHLVPWLAQLSERAKTLLSSSSLFPPNRMHLYEFLSCVATAVEDPVARANFVADVLANALEVIESATVKESLSSVERLMDMMGISQVATNPGSATDAENVRRITATFVSVFSSFNQLLSVGKRCNEAARKRPNGGIPVVTCTTGTIPNNNFPDEGPVSINDLAINDPFVPLWPRILPTLIRVLDVTLRLWHPQYQAVLLKNPIQRYVYAISDDEAYLAMKTDSSTGGVFGEGGTAGTVVAGWDRRDMNLAPKWSGWFNELRNTSFQLLGLLSGQRVLFAPEIAGLFPELVSTVINPDHLRSMEHRHFTQYLKQFIEILLLACPVTLYQSHLSPILEPVFEHVVHRLQMSWKPVLASSNQGDLSSLKALSTPGCDAAALLAASGGEQWYSSYYARGGLFVGDMQGVGVESSVEKVRVELSRTFSDVLQSALALKGDWALVLANQAKEEQALKKNDASKLNSGPITRVGDTNGGRVNADGTPRGANEAAIEARKTLRINEMCRFILLADEKVAYSLASAVVDALEYPDAYTCRRCTKICHRILEACAWDARYTQLIGSRMFGKAVKAIVTEPKWMVGIEWDMINLIRDIYVRLVLGQTLLPGGQGPAMQQPKDPNNPLAFEQAKNADKPLVGGGILCMPSDFPREVFASLPGIGVEAVRKLDADMTEKRSAKDQKDFLRELLRIAAENLKEAEGTATADSIFGRADASEGLLGQNIKRDWVAGDKEKLVTASMIRKQQQAKADEPTSYGVGDLFKLA